MYVRINVHCWVYGVCSVTAIYHAFEDLALCSPAAWKVMDDDVLTPVFGGIHPFRVGNFGIREIIHLESITIKPAILNTYGLLRLCVESDCSRRCCGRKSLSLLVLYRPYVSIAAVSVVQVGSNSPGFFGYGTVGLGPIYCGDCNCHLSRLFP